ncbi:MAG: hypothetical protein B6U87_02010 [Candidatus Aenigmarchaeota archaeon ex4484_52]|nr:MAG: hypothetical protein B6U87_02010 [Candidatus Aenigmarchaeota archaeon ex4484_52]
MRIDITAGNKDTKNIKYTFTCNSPSGMLDSLNAEVIPITADEIVINYAHKLENDDITIYSGFHSKDAIFQMADIQILK